MNKKIKRKTIKICSPDNIKGSITTMHTNKESHELSSGEKHRITSLRNGQNSLATVNPMLAAEWDIEKNDLTPNDVTPSSSKKAWWICPTCGYSYYSSVANRHKNRSGCPVCANQVLCSGKNDLQTMYPDIAAEWSSKNNVTPDCVLAGGHSKYFFKCSHCGYEWETKVINRILGKGCPKCSFSLHTSIPEQVIFQCLKSVFLSAENSYRPEWLDGKEIDIFLPEINVGIEYDGGGWHRNVKKDIEKTNIMHEHGIQLIRIREKKCPSIDDGSIQIETLSDLKHLKQAIKELFSLLINQFHTVIEHLPDVDSIYNHEITKFRNKELDDSFLSYYPELMREWNYIKNKGIDASKISRGSKISVWWKCKKCGYEWQAPIDRRTHGAGCPYCKHEVVWEGHNDLKTLHPDLVEEWDFKKNKVLPEKVMPNSHQLIWWKCSRCGFSWRTPLYTRAMGHGCPKCAQVASALRSSKKVKNLDTGKIYRSAIEAANETGISHSCITRVCRGEGKKAGGYHWEYLSEDENK